MTLKRSGWIWILPIAALVTLGALGTQRHAQAQQDTPTHAEYDFPSVGIVRGEKLRVSVVNPHRFPPGPCRILVLDTKGKTIGDSGEFQLPAVQFHFRDFAFEKLAGATDTAEQDRVQVRVIVLLTNPNGFPPGPCIPGLEMIKANTGHTFGILPPPTPNLF